MRKVELMHKMFGRSPEYLCRECVHYTHKYYNGKPYRKCDVYGNSNSEGTDWKGSDQGCGLAPDKAYKGRPIVELVKYQKKIKDDAVPDGQMKMRI